MAHLKYEKYQDSGFKWLGLIPENWSINRLKGISTLFGRIGFRGYSQEDIVDFEEGAITVSPSNMINGHLDFSKNTYLSWEKYDESPEIKLEAGDVIMVKTGSTIGKVSFADSINYPSTINPQLMIFKNIKCHKKFLFYFLFSDNIQSIIPLHNTGSTIPTMTQEAIGKLPIPLPSINEQILIVNFLDTETSRIDTLIEKKQTFIETLKEKRISIISNAVTKGLKSDTVLKDSHIEWLKKIPEHWEEKALKYTCSINDEALPETTNPDYEISYVDIGSIDKTLGIVNKEKYIFDDAPSRARRIVKDGDIIVSTVRTYLRAIAPVINPEDNLIVSTGFAVIRPRIINSRYLAYLIASKYFVEKVVSMSVGVSYPAINSSALANIKILIPEQNEQVQIADYLDKETSSIDKLIELTEKHIDKLQEYKSALISSVVTGKVKVIE
ncbi:MAG: restriction endonuclease subunit S [Bacteroidales bacterium]